MTNCEIGLGGSNILYIRHSNRVMSTGTSLGDFLTFFVKSPLIPNTWSVVIIIELFLKRIEKRLSASQQI